MPPHAQRVRSLVEKGAGFEAYSVACDGGEMLAIRRFAVNLATVKSCAEGRIRPSPAFKLDARKEPLDAALDNPADVRLTIFLVRYARAKRWLTENSGPIDVFDPAEHFSHLSNKACDVGR